jgi:hypothetical protein
MQIFGANFLQRTSPEFSGADRDGGGWDGSPTPDRDPIWHSVTNYSKPCSNLGSSPSPPLTPEAEKFGSRDKLTHHPPSSSPAPVKGARRCRGRVRQGSESPLPSLACPFYRFDPRSHRDCRTFTLRRVKDIKQHIQRKHTILPDSEFYCDLCLDLVDAEPHHEMVAHTHQQGPHHTLCPLKHSNPLQGVITSEQKEKLKNYLGRGKAIHEQWYDMWDILFPGHRQPRTIHLDSINNSREGRLRMLRRVWETHRVEILRAACTPPASIPSGIPQTGLGSDSLNPWRGPSRPSWQQSYSVLSARPIAAAATATSESFAQWRPFDQVMDAFLDLVKEEMMDDVVDVQVADTDGSNSDNTVVEATGSLLEVQQSWCPGVGDYYPEDLDSILWQSSAEPEIEFSGIGMAQGTLALASGGVIYNFPAGLSDGPW